MECAPLGRGWSPPVLPSTRGTLQALTLVGPEAALFDSSQRQARHREDGCWSGAAQHLLRSPSPTPRHRLRLWEPNFNFPGGDTEARELPRGG